MKKFILSVAAVATLSTGAFANVNTDYEMFKKKLEANGISFKNLEEKTNKLNSEGLLKASVGQFYESSGVELGYETIIRKDMLSEIPNYSTVNFKMGMNNESVKDGLFLTGELKNYFHAFYWGKYEKKDIPSFLLSPLAFVIKTGGTTFSKDTTVDTAGSKKSDGEEKRDRVSDYLLGWGLAYQDPFFMNEYEVTYSKGLTGNVDYELEGGIKFYQIDENKFSVIAKRTKDDVDSYNSVSFQYSYNFDIM